MTRDEKWGKVWFAIEKIYTAARGDSGKQKILNEQRNFSLHPTEVFFSLFQSIQPECAMKNIPMDILFEAVSTLDKNEYTNTPLSEEYLYAYMVALHNDAESNGDKIIRARNAAGLTQAQLADKIGCTQKDISRWETGTRNPSAEYLKKIAAVCNCFVDDLI